LIRLSGGRTWWAHLQFTPINIEPIILRKKIEDAREVGASTSIASMGGAVGKSCGVIRYLSMRDLGEAPRNHTCRSASVG
jgi:hypothetical protein